MLLMKKGILGCNIIYLFILICIGIALPIKSQNNYKVKLTGTVYESTTTTTSVCLQNLQLCLFLKLH